MSNIMLLGCLLFGLSTAGFNVGWSWLPLACFALLCDWYRFKQFTATYKGD